MNPSVWRRYLECSARLHAVKLSGSLEHRIPIERLEVEFEASQQAYTPLDLYFSAQVWCDGDLGVAVSDLFPCTKANLPQRRFRVLILPRECKPTSMSALACGRQRKYASLIA